MVKKINACSWFSRLLILWDDLESCCSFEPTTKKWLDAHFHLECLFKCWFDLWVYWELSDVCKTIIKIVYGAQIKRKLLYFIGWISEKERKQWQAIIKIRQNKKKFNVCYKISEPLILLRELMSPSPHWSALWYIFF